MKKQSNPTGAPVASTNAPLLKWQTGSYKRHASFQFVLPHPFLFVCRLLEITPETLLRDFIDNLSCGSWNREGRDDAKKSLIAYMLQHGYGQQHYTEQDIQQMFRELDAVGLLFPVDGSTKLLLAYEKWRDKQQVYWFKKWYKKPRRKQSKNNPL